MGQSGGRLLFNRWHKVGEIMLGRTVRNTWVKGQTGVVFCLRGMDVQDLGALFDFLSGTDCDRTGTGVREG